MNHQPPTLPSIIVAVLRDHPLTAHGIKRVLTGMAGTQAYATVTLGQIKHALGLLRSHNEVVRYNDTGVAVWYYNPRDW